MVLKLTKRQKYHQRWLRPNNRISGDGNVCTKNICIASLWKKTIPSPQKFYHRSNLVLRYGNCSCKSCSIERRQKWYSILRPCNWLKMMECSIINSSMEPATVKQIVPLIGRAGRPTQIMFYISKERLKEIFHCAKEKYALKANFFKH